MARMNWTRVYWESRFARAAREGFTYDDNRLSQDRQDRAPVQRGGRAPAIPATTLAGAAGGDHSVTISAALAKRWVGVCRCGWKFGPTKKSAVEAKSRRHLDEPEADRPNRVIASSRRSIGEGDPSRWFPTEVTCHQCDRLLLVISSPTGEATGARCPGCRMQWALQTYEPQTQEWLREALAAVGPRVSAAPSTRRPSSHPGMTVRRRGGAVAPGSQDRVCKHRIVAGHCPLCKGKGVVYITGGGTHFHRRMDCPSLASGQRKVYERGGDAMPIEGVVVKSLRLISRDPCRTCFPVAAR